MNAKIKQKYNDVSYIKNIEEYKKIYNDSMVDGEKFWSSVAENLIWYKGWSKVSEVDYAEAKIKWFEGGKLNACYNCIDRHVVEGNGDKTAIIWESNNPLLDVKVSYKELLLKVSRFANGLKSLGVKKGDRVCIYLQMIPELAIAMRACARIGAVHSIIFGGFSADSISGRI